MVGFNTKSIDFINYVQPNKKKNYIWSLGPLGVNAENQYNK